MTSYWSSAAVIVGIDAMLDLLDAGGAGQLRIYDSGTAPPANADAAVGGGDTLLATLNLSATGFAGATDIVDSAQAAANTITGANAVGTGTADYCRLYTNGGTCVWQGTVGVGSGNLQMVSVVITAGNPVSCSAFTMTIPESAA